MKVLIAGCGYVGTKLGEALVRQAEVWGLRRDWSKSQKPSFHMIEADLLDPASLKNLPKVRHVVICQAPSKDSDSYLKTYLEATKNLLSAVSWDKPEKIILVSSTSVYGTSDGSWVNENTDPLGTPHADAESLEHAKILLEAEKAVLESKMPGVVLRLGGIYGPGRNRIQALKSGAFTPALSEDYTNRIHVDDVVTCLELLLRKGRAGEIYLGVDEHPCTQKEFYTWLYGKLGLKEPAAGTGRMRPPAWPAGRHGANKRCANKKIKSLGMKFEYPTYKEGYSSFL